MRLRSVYNELMDPDALDVPIDCLSFEEYLKVDSLKLCRAHVYRC